MHASNILDSESSIAGASRQIKKTTNNQKSTLIGVSLPINQKNFYTDYLKRDEQLVVPRQINELQKSLRDKKKDKDKETVPSTVPNSENASRAGDDEEDASDDETDSNGQRVIIIHPGSHNLRIGLGSDPVPRTIPFCIARRGLAPFSQKRSLESDERFNKVHNMVTNDFKARMQYYKRKLVINAHDQCASFNSSSIAEIIPEHNDTIQEEWTDMTNKDYVTGDKALLVSDPTVNLYWPIRYGELNEMDYENKTILKNDIALILIDALRDLNIKGSQIKLYSVVLLLPDLYDRNYLQELIQILLVDMDFMKVAIIQESVAVTFGSGISAACVVDVGAQSTTISCVDDGICLPDSRIRMRFGGDDITHAFAKFLMKSSFPYNELDLQKMHDWKLIDDLKIKCCTVNDANITVQLHQFFRRQKDEKTRKYSIKVYEEVIAAPMTLFYPKIYEIAEKSYRRYHLYPRSRDVYDDIANNPTSKAQLAFSSGNKTKSETTIHLNIGVSQATSTSDLKSIANTPDDVSASGTPAPSDKPMKATDKPKATDKKTGKGLKKAEEDEDDSLVIEPLDHAIIKSITEGCAGNTELLKRMYMNVMVVGQGAMFPGFYNLLAERLRYFREGTHQVTLTPPPREIDAAILAWKGANVFSKLNIAQECYLNQKDWDLLGTRALQHRLLWSF